MKTDYHQQFTPVFLQTLNRALSHLKQQLQRDYENAYPGLGEIIHLILDQEEAKAWELSFPHLFLPDLVEEHISQLGLRPAEIRGDRVPPPGHFSTDQNHQLVPAYADC